MHIIANADELFAPTHGAFLVRFNTSIMVLDTCIIWDKSFFLTILICVAVDQLQFASACPIHDSIFFTHSSEKNAPLFEKQGIVCLKSCYVLFTDSCHD